MESGASRPPGDPVADHVIDVVLTRFADVVDALTSPALVAGAPGAHDDRDGPSVDRTTRTGFSTGALRGALAAAAGDAARMAASLPLDSAVDLLGDYARPVALSLAMHVGDAPISNATALARDAAEVFLAGAHAKGASTDGRVDAAVQHLALALQQSAPPAVAPLAVQAFVALACTLPHFLAGAWLALFEHPDQLATLRADPGLLPGAIEELLRFAGPSRAVFRRSIADLTIGSTSIHSRAAVVLDFHAANRDPSHFSDPDHLDVRRLPVGHLAFGRGSHACVGASLVRSAAAIMTGALLARPVDVERASPVEWLDGFAIQAPGTLPVVLRAR